MKGVEVCVSLAAWQGCLGAQETSTLRKTATAQVWLRHLFPWGLESTLVVVGSKNGQKAPWCLHR